MTLPPLLRTPLAATAAVAVGLLAMAIPLRQLTRATTPAPAVATPAVADKHRAAWVTLKLLAAADAVTLATTNGTPLWHLGPSGAGDHEARLDLPLGRGHAEFILEVTRPDGTPETAAFLTIAPDGMDERQAHAIGSGRIRELMTFDW